MKRTILSLALTSVLAACGSAADAPAPEPVAPVQQAETALPETSLPPTTLAEPAPAPEQPKIDVAAPSDFLDPMSNTGGTPFEAPAADETPVSEGDLKFLNIGVARAVMEYRMVGESLKWGLAGSMGQGVDAWIKLEVARCRADTEGAFRYQTELNQAQSRDMCIGQAYGLWALVNGTAGTEGSPRQCLEKGYCGYMFRQYDLSADPAFAPAGMLDSAA